MHGKNCISRYFWNFVTDTRGVTAVEYGLLIGIIGGALILGLGGVRDSLLGVLTTIVEALTNALPS